MAGAALESQCTSDFGFEASDTGGGVLIRGFLPLQFGGSADGAF
jgi:hypothetical protein